MTPEQFMEGFGVVVEAEGGIARLRELVLVLAMHGTLLAPKELEVNRRKTTLGQLVSFRQELIRPADKVDEQVVFVGPEHIERNSGRRLGGVQTHTSQLGGRKFRFSPGQIVYTYLRPYLNKVWLADAEGVCSVDQYVLMTNERSVLPRYLRDFVLSPLFLKQANELTHGLMLPRLRSGLLKQIKIELPTIPEQHRIVAKVDQLMAMLDDLEQRQEQKRTTAIHVSKASLNSLVNAEDPDQLARAWERVTKNFGVLARAGSGTDRLSAAILELACSGRLTHQQERDGSAEDLVGEISARRFAWISDAMIAGSAEATRLAKKLHTQEVLDSSNTLIPHTWRRVALGRLCWRLIDCEHKTAPYTDKGVHLIRTTDVRSGEINLKNTKFVSEETYAQWTRRCPPEPGDVIFTREAPMGEAGVIPDGIRVCLGQRTVLMRVFHDLVDVQYLILTLRDPRFQTRMRDAAVGSTVKHLRVSDVEGLWIPVPPLAEQKRIVERAHHLLKLATDLRTCQEQASIFARKLASSISSA